jgi:predicted RNA-binding Zn ribbon-like protein
MVRVDGGALLRAVILREAIYRALDRVRQIEDPDPADVAVIVAEHGRCLSTAVLMINASAGDVDGGRVSWGWNENDERAILGPLVIAALPLLTGEAAGRVRCCPGSQCGWLFLDITRNGRRRWCDMAVCGNRAKAGRHRAARRNGQKGTEQT